MSKKTLGELLKETREKRKISKTRLSKGLCTITALSRYENDERIASKVLVDALLERLGINPYKYEFIISEEEFLCSIIRNEINSFIRNAQYDSASKAIEKYERRIKLGKNLHLQYICLKRGELMMSHKEYCKAEDYLIKGLECTDCEIGTKQIINNILLTNIEMELFYKLAECLFLQNKQEEAYVIFCKLKEYIDSIDWDNEKKTKYYPHILYRLSNIEMEKENIEVAYEYIVEAENIMLQEYKIEEFIEILQLKNKLKCLKVEEIKAEEKEFLLALEIINLTSEGNILEKGVGLWENIVNQQL